MMLFKDTIKSKVNLEGFTTEEQHEILEKLEENIIIKINLTLLDALKPADRDEFYTLSEKPQNPVLTKFLEDRIPNISAVVRKAADEVIDEFNSLRS